MSLPSALLLILRIARAAGYGVRWIDQFSVIIVNYLKGWFMIDAFSLVPSSFDIIPLVLSSEDGALPAASKWRLCGDVRCLVLSADNSPSFLSRLKAFRIVRVFRLIKLVRLLRASRVLRRWETRLSVSFAMQQLARCCFLYLIAAHWFGCGLVVAVNFYDNPMETWLGYFGYCVSEPSSVTATFENPSAYDHFAWAMGDRNDDAEYVPDEALCRFPRGLSARPDLAISRILDGSCTVRCAMPSTVYAGAVFLALQIICGASGAQFAHTVHNFQEQCVFAVVIIAGAMTWGYVIGTLVSVISNFNPDLTWYRGTLDQLNRFMSVSELPHEMRIRLREYFQQSRHIHRGEQRKQLMRLMSPSLQGEVCMMLNRKWLQSVDFLQGTERDFVVLISTSLHPSVFAPGEVVTFGYLYIVHKGVALWAGKVLTGGGVFGHDMILRKQSLCRFSARAMTYLEVYRISRSQLLELARPFPKASEAIRWEAIRLAFKRTISELAEQYRKREKLAQLLLQQKKDESETGIADDEFNSAYWRKDEKKDSAVDSDALTVDAQPSNPLATEDMPTLHTVTLNLASVQGEVTRCFEAIEALSATLNSSKDTRARGGVRTQPLDYVYAAGPVSPAETATPVEMALPSPWPFNFGAPAPADAGTRSPSRESNEMRSLSKASGASLGIGMPHPRASPHMQPPTNFGGAHVGGGPSRDAEITKLLKDVLSQQTMMTQNFKKELARQGAQNEALHAEMAAEIKYLRNWICTDALAKLQA